MSDLARVRQLLGPGEWAGLREERERELGLAVPLESLPALADRLAAEAALASLFATDERSNGGAFRVHHVWSLPRCGAFLRLHAQVDPSRRAFPSISGRHPAANWFEREIQDYFGLVPQGHPNPRRVALHDDWPEGAWPLRKDFADDAAVPRVTGSPHPFRPVRGEGVFQIPVGPVHAGVIEPGHFRFGVAGEPVLDLQLRLFYVHKGVEKRFERLPWRQGLFLAESISGDSAVAHALAFAHALERLTGTEAPARASYLRVVLLELERIYNHVSDIGAIATDVAFVAPAAQAQLLRERLVALHEKLFGSRLLRGTVAPGGARRDLDRNMRNELGSHLARFRPAFEGLVTLLIDSGSFTDRIDGTGVLSRQAALDLGVVGLAARASGVDQDLRRDHPTDAYGLLRLEVPLEQGGDVRARLMVRAREVELSVGLVERALEALEALEETVIVTPLPATLPASSSALGWAEGWRGGCLHWIQTDAEGRLSRVKVDDPSFKNWPGLAWAVPGNIVPDFPVINKSFNLSYSGNDR